jgi:hypothetical protein
MILARLQKRLGCDSATNAVIVKRSLLTAASRPACARLSRRPLGQGARDMQFISRIFSVFFDLHQRVREVLPFVWLDPDTAG